MNLESIQIHLNSKYADSFNIPNSTTDANFYLPLIELPNQHTILLSIQSASIPYTFYNIDSTNNCLVYTTDSILTQNYVYLQVGNYNANQLATAMSNLITNFSASYSVITNRFTFTNSVENFKFYPVSSCFPLIGFSNDILYSTSILKSLTSFNCVNLLSKQNICIQSNLHTGNINHSNLSEGNILCSIPINVPPYSIITYSNNANFKTNMFSNHIEYINIRIVDQDNTLVDLNNCHWSITLQIDVVKFVE